MFLYKQIKTIFLMHFSWYKQYTSWIYWIWYKKSKLRRW